MFLCNIFLFNYHNFAIIIVLKYNFPLIFKTAVLYFRFSKVIPLGFVIKTGNTAFLKDFVWKDLIPKNKAKKNPNNSLWKSIGLIFENYLTAAVVRGCPVKKLSLKISQLSLEDTSVGVSLLIKLQASGLRPARLATSLKKRHRHGCFLGTFS